MLRAFFALAGLMVVSASCSDDDPSRPRSSDEESSSSGGSGDQPDASANTDGSVLPDGGAADACRKIDFVFVVDDSASMAEEQANLAANLPRFIAALDAFGQTGVPLDWRAAVTTTGRTVQYTIEPTPSLPPINVNELGDDGAFRMRAECGVPRRWVEHSDTDAAERFACQTRVGTSGPSLEMPLEALKLALVDRVADQTNAGFRRDDAMLAIVVLTDEDDCSRSDDGFTVSSDACMTSWPDDVTPLTDYVAMLDQVAGGRERWSFLSIAGDTACESDFGTAIEATRLKQLTSMNSIRGRFSSICAGDLDVALQESLTHFVTTCESE